MTHINIVKFKELFKIEDLLEYFGRKCFNRDIVAEIFSILAEEEFSIVETNTTNKIVLTYSIIKPKTTHNYLSKIIAMVDLDVNHNYKFFELIYTNYMNDLVNQKLDDKKKLTISEINSINDMYSKVNSMEFVPRRDIKAQDILKAQEMILKVTPPKYKVNFQDNPKHIVDEITNYLRTIEEPITFTSIRTYIEELERKHNTFVKLEFLPIPVELPKINQTIISTDNAIGNIDLEQALVDEKEAKEKYMLRNENYLNKLSKNFDNLLDKTIIHNIYGFNTFHFDDEFFYDVIIKFQEYCETQCSFFSGNIFDYDFVGEFITRVKNDKVTFSYSTHEVIINGDKMQFPRFKNLGEITEMIENYYITILYFDEVYAVPANKLAHSSNSHQI